MHEHISFFFYAYREAWFFDHGLRFLWRNCCHGSTSVVVSQKRFTDRGQLHTDVRQCDCADRVAPSVDLSLDRVGDKQVVFVVETCISRATAE
jgi:hypothetical protein